jgi:hypothetical protein
MTTYFIMEDKMAIAQQMALRKLGFQQWPSQQRELSFPTLRKASDVGSKCKRHHQLTSYHNNARIKNNKCFN